MPVCPKCGLQNCEGSIYCSSCGTPLNAPIEDGSVPDNQENQRNGRFSFESRTDALIQRALAISVYIAPILPLLVAGKKEYRDRMPYVKLHLNQALILFFFQLGLLLLFGLPGIFLLPVSPVASAVFITLMRLTNILIGVFQIIGIVHAVQCVNKKLPLFGSLKLFK